MERLNDRTATQDDRELRERLEQVQMELRGARAALATAREDSARAESALRGAVEDATIRRDAAWAKVQALRDEKSALPVRLQVLERRLVDKHKEAAVLARGSVLRDQEVDWRHGDRVNPSGLNSFERRTIMWLIIAAVMFLIGIIHAATK